MTNPVHPPRGPGIVAMLALLPALLAACSAEAPDAPEPACGRLVVTVTDPAGMPLSAFQVVVDPGVGTPLAADCSGGGDRAPGTDCQADAARVEVPAASSYGLTVKALGYRTLRTTVAPAWGPAVAGPSCGPRSDAPVAVALVALPALEATADYRTGFDDAGGLDAFTALAFPAVDDLGPALVLKFFADWADGETRVWFQDTRKHPIHYDFVQRVLKRPVSRSQFEEDTYVREDRTQAAGSLIWRPDARLSLGGREVRGLMTLEWFPSDHLTPAMVARVFLALQERMGFLPLSGGASRLAYLPPGSTQEAQALAAARDLAAAGVTWVSRDLLFAGVTEQRLNAAVSFGLLRRLTPQELVATPLSYTDVVLLTRLPNDLPLVGGTITEELQTPLAHVNVAARSRGTPNLALLDASEDPRVKPFLGKRVRFEVTAATFTLREATAQEVDDFWRQSLDRTPLVPEADLQRDGLPGFGDLGFADAVAVGVKAANLAQMRKVLPQNVPDGFAVPFRHYEAFVTTATTTLASCDGAADDCLEEARGAALCDRVRAFCRGPGAAAGETLRAHLDRLLADPDARTDSAYREVLLDAVRWQFCHLPLDPAFGTALDARVREVFGGTTVRLRSSSNAEDLPDFSGAGLYDSVSATLDGDKPPSGRICKVWGSLWNWKAVEERSFWNVDQGAVRMGVAVHPAFPDEQANGVLITRNVVDPSLTGMYVNVQKGELSVTNPEDGAVPEVFVIIPGPAGTQVARLRFSSLSPGVPLLADAEVLALALAAGTVQEHFAPLYPDLPSPKAFDIEFKFHGPARDLVLKQVRPFRIR